MVNLTAGSVVLGVFDKIDEVADVCQQHGVWLHVDACWGGAVLLSDKLKHKVKGLDRADSVAWDPHKMPGAGQQCAVLITKHVRTCLTFKFLVNFEFILYNLTIMSDTSDASHSKNNLFYCFCYAMTIS